jgi:hypothetical protein
MKKISFLFFALIFAVSSCKIEYIDDPYVPQQGPPAPFFPQLIYAMAEGPMFDGRFIGRYTQNWHLTTANDFYDRHGSRRTAAQTGLTASQVWRNHYWSVGSNLNQIEIQAKARNLAQYVGIAKAIRAWSWQLATDQFGEMPYKQAWDNTLTSFVYDSQKDIYAGINQLCDEAIQELTANQGIADPQLRTVETIYNGDNARWIKFAWAVKARIANHISNKRSYNPAQVIEFVDKALANNNDNALVRFSAANSDQSSFMGPTRVNFTAFRQSNYFANLLNGTLLNGVTDPRASLMLNPTTTTQRFVGVEPVRGITPTGFTTTTMPTIYGRFIFTDNAPFPLITYSEMQFIKAEAAFRQNNRALAFSAFQEGIRAHMQQINVPAANITTYLTSAAVPQTATTLTLRDIMTQKYIAMWGWNYHETWTDLRRYNYSGDVFAGFTLPTPLAPENNNQTVQRLLPTTFSEEDWNRAEFAKVGGMDVNYHIKPIWFATTEE